MSDTLGPLPDYAHEFRPRWPGDSGGFTAAQMQAYALAEVQRMLERCISLYYESHDIAEAAKRIESLRQGAVMDDFHNKLLATPQP